MPLFWSMDLRRRGMAVSEDAEPVVRMGEIDQNLPIGSLVLRCGAPDRAVYQRIRD